MMRKLLEKVAALADEELKMANEQHPLFASDHEGSAVIHEEVEEAKYEMEMMQYFHDLLWSDVKEDENITENAENLMLHSIRCACECIQVAAMCEKAKSSK